MIGRTYHRRYGYRWREAIPAELWWRVEHCGPRDYTTKIGALFGILQSFGYAKRKQWEHKGAAHRA